MVVVVKKNKKKTLPASAGNIRDESSVLGSGRSPGGKHGNPLSYSCLENHMDGKAWWATAHGVPELDMTEQPPHPRGQSLSWSG